jgi:carbazole 1,9a-dioxygenase terminal dioxygenase component
MPRDGFVEEELLANVKSWRTYFAAKLGFRNHWYVAGLATEFAEGEPLARKILGEDILFRRIDGRVYAMHDRCIHRGVKLSDKVECHTKGTISCWYHGFTYRWEDGGLCDIIGAPESRAIGRKKIKVYPTEEAKGLVFVFIGDADFVAPPLSHDAPPEFLDENTTVETGVYNIASNWRLGPEGGIDEIHRYLHRESPLLLNTRSAMPLGHAAVKEQFELVEDKDGPCGVIDHFAPDKMYFDGSIEGETVVRGVTFGSAGAPKRAVSASIWMPACLRVKGFPDAGLTLFEWYVPIDETTHRCFMTLSKTVANDEEARAFSREFHTRWKPLALEGFLTQDIMARESAQAFYAKDRSWLEEVLIEEDFMLIEWRKLCSRNARGVQTPEHMD